MEAIMKSGGAQKEEQLSAIRKSKRETLARLEKQELLQSQLKSSTSFAASSASASASTSTSWTSSYKSWDMWEDKDELRTQITASEAKEDQLMQAQRSMVGCGSSDRSAERRVVEMELGGRLQFMKKYIDEGNGYFEEGQYARAATKYKRVLIYYEYCFPETKVEEKQCDSLRIVSLMNSAICHMKLSLFDEALENCKQCLAMDPANVKCLYRKAAIYRHKDEFELARKDIDEAISIDPGNKRLHHERDLLRGKIAAYKKSSKALVGKMFGHSDSEEKKDNTDNDNDSNNNNNNKTKEAKFQTSGDTSTPMANFYSSLGDHKVKLDDLFVPIAVDVAGAEELVSGLTGINLMDATTLRGVKDGEEKKRGGGLSWSFRHPVSCECQAPEIDFDDEVEVEGEGEGEGVGAGEGLVEVEKTNDAEDVLGEMDDLEKLDKGKMERAAVDEIKEVMGVGGGVGEGEGGREERHYDRDEDNVFDLKEKEKEKVLEAIEVAEVKTSSIRIPTKGERTFLLAAVLLIVLSVRMKLPTPVLVVVGGAFGHLVEKKLSNMNKEKKKEKVE